MKNEQATQSQESVEERKGSYHSLNPQAFPVLRSYNNVCVVYCAEGGKHLKTIKEHNLYGNSNHT